MRRADVISNEPVETSPPIPRRHRLGLWVVGLYFVFPAANGLVVVTLLLMGAFDAVPGQAARLQDFPIWRLVPAYTVMVLNMAGGILLLMRYRVALPILVVSAGLNAATLLFLIIKGLVPEPGVSVILSFLPYPLLIAALIYVDLLRRRGVLDGRLFGSGAR